MSEKATLEYNNKLYIIDKEYEDKLLEYHRSNSHISLEKAMNRLLISFEKRKK